MTAPQESARALDFHRIELALSQLHASSSRDDAFLLAFDAREALNRLRAALAALDGEARERENDTARLDYLADRAQKDDRVDLNFTEAWQESGDYGSILSHGPREFWLRDDGSECGPTLRAAIDAAMQSDALAPLPSVTDEPHGFDSDALFRQFEQDAVAAVKAAGGVGGDKPVAFRMTDTTSED